MLPVVIVIFLALALAAASLYARWRLSYRYPPPGAAQVLCYHKLSSRFCWEGTWTTPRRFFAAVDRLLDHGYRFIDEGEYLATMTADGGDASRLFLTFDDGYEEVRTEACDGLLERGVPFHVFLVTDFAGRANAWDLSLGRRPFYHASWDQVREMAGAGVTFGSHGASHRDLTRLSAAAIDDELVRSKRTIEDELGRAVKTVSYPFGRYNDEVKAAASRAGYQAGFSLYPGHANERIDRFALRRNGVYVIDAARTVQAKVRRHPLFWLEEMKCRSINAVAVLTPLLKNRW